MNQLPGIVCLAQVAASRPAAADMPITELQATLLVVGALALLGWIAARLVRPREFWLECTPGRPNRLNILHVGILFLVFHVSLVLAARAVAAWMGVTLELGTQPPMTVTLPAMPIGQCIMIVGSLAVASMTMGHGIRQGLGLSLRRPLLDALRGAAAFLCALPICYLALAITTGLLPERLRNIHPILDFLPTVRQSPGWLMLIVLSTCVLAPLAEELFFRGLLQSLFRRYWGRPWLAILPASALFALAHAGQYQDMPALFLLGIVLGYNYERTGRLTGPIIAHALFNGLTISSLLRALG